MIRVLYVSVDQTTGEEKYKISNVRITQEQLEEFMGVEFVKLYSDPVDKSWPSGAITLRYKSRVCECDRLYKLKNLSSECAEFFSLYSCTDNETMKIAILGWSSGKIFLGQYHKSKIADIFNMSAVTGNMVLFFGFSIENLRVY